MKFLKFLTTYRFNYIDTIYFALFVTYLSLDEYLNALIVFVLGTVISVAAKVYVDTRWIGK
jgi:hypothetical protein